MKKNFELAIGRLLVELERIPSEPDEFGPIEAERLIAALIDYAISMIESADFNEVEKNNGKQPNLSLGKLTSFRATFHDFFLLPHVYQPFQEITILEKRLINELQGGLRAAVGINQQTSYMLGEASAALNSIENACEEIGRVIRNDYWLGRNQE